MKMFNYLKKLKLTGEEIKEGIKVLAIYSHHFSKTINDLPLYPSEKDKFEMNFSMVRKNIADEVIRMFLYEIDRVRISFDNPKFLTKIYKGEILYVIANNIFALYNYCNSNYKILSKERKIVNEQKRDYLNLYTKPRGEMSIIKIIEIGNY